jgi:hypothetical protein
VGTRQGVERVKIIGRECPRISVEFLEQQRVKLGPLPLSQEFEGQFIDSDTSVFSSAMVEMALADDFERLAA